MDAIKQKNAALKERCKTLHEQLRNLETKCEAAKLRAESLGKWSQRLRRESVELDAVLDTLPKPEAGTPSRVLHSQWKLITSKLLTSPSV
jgi:hypothetical protein